MKRYSVVVPDDIHQALRHHLLRMDGQEDLCFATYVPSNGKERHSGILSTIILPDEGERNVHGNVGFLPEYFERSMLIARKRKEGLVFLHSHPIPGWQRMSSDDVIAESRMAPAASTLTGFPLVGMTIGTDQAWSARFWIKDDAMKRKFNRYWCESVRVLGKKLSVTFNDDLLPPQFDSMKQLRTISAWGRRTQEDLSRFRIGIVGLGSVGSIVAEILARTGFSNFVLIDFDTVEEKNLDRTNVLKADIGRAKVCAIEDTIRRSATSPKLQIEPVEYSICEQKGYLSALDCDILFSCVDRPWPRQILNFIAYAHMIPVIDGGILVRSNKDNTRMIGADWKVQTVGYKRPCLECLGQYKTENANLEKEGKLDDPSYLAGLDRSQFIDAHENVYVFSSNVASLEVLQLQNMLIAPSGMADVGQQMYHFVSGQLDRDKSKDCYQACYFQEVVGRGDLVNTIVYGVHPVAEAARKLRLT
jgi:molybdopterin-synthase adenylyltransferase